MTTWSGRIVYHGGGLIGFTGAQALAEQGFDVTVYETDEKRATAIDRKLPTTTNWGLIDDARGHIFAIPTERDGRPDMETLCREIYRLTGALPLGALIIIESTLVPGTVDAIASRLEKDGRPDVMLVVAPRRDVFGVEGQTLRDVPRVIGAVTDQALEMGVAILGMVSPLIPTTHREAELVKPLENALLAAPLALLHEAAKTYLGVDMAEVVKLAATHPRLPNYYLDLGTSGYCVPVAPRYLEAMTFSRSIDRANRRFDEWVAKKIAAHVGGGTAAFLGLRLKVSELSWSMSHAARLTRLLTRMGVQVLIHDSKVAPSVIDDLGADWLDLDRAPLSRVNALVVSLPDPEYASLHSAVAPATLVIDACQLWRSHEGELIERGVYYSWVGRRDWL